MSSIGIISILIFLFVFIALTVGLIKSDDFKEFIKNVKEKIAKDEDINNKTESTKPEYAKNIFGTFIAVVIIMFTTIYAFQYFKVFVAEMDGKAKKMEASQARLVLVEQAKAERDAAKLRAEAIEIVGEMTQKYPEYRKQEYIGAFAEALKEGNIKQIVYIPTEAGIPILEARR